MARWYLEHTTPMNGARMKILEYCIPVSALEIALTRQSSK
jgi:hypothetical protein